MKFDLFYQLPAVAGQDSGQRYAELIEQAREADRLGFHSLWLAEVHFMHRFSLLPAPMMLLAAIAQATQRLKLGLAVNLLRSIIRRGWPRSRRPWTFSAMGGWNSARAAAPSPATIAAIRFRWSKAASVCRRIGIHPAGLATTALTFEGKFYRAADLEVIPKPLQQPHPPIRIAANSPETFSFAGSFGFPIFAAAGVNPPNLLDTRLELYRQGLADADHRVPDDWLCLSDDDLHRPRRKTGAADRRAQHAPLLRSDHRVLEPQSQAPEHVEQLEKIKKRMRSVTYESTAANTALFGEPAACVDRIKELRERFGITRIVCWFEFGGLKGHREVIDSMRLWAEEVMPQCKD